MGWVTYIHFTVPNCQLLNTISITDAIASEVLHLKKKKKVNMTKKVFTKLSVLSYKTIDCFQFHYFTHNANFYLQLNDLKNKTKNPSLLSCSYGNKLSECWSNVWTSTIKMRIYLLAIPQAENPVLPLDLHLLKSCSECSIPETSSSDNGHQSPWSTDPYWIPVSVLFPDLSATPSPFETKRRLVCPLQNVRLSDRKLDFG